MGGPDPPGGEIAVEEELFPGAETVPDCPGRRLPHPGLDVDQVGEGVVVFIGSDEIFAMEPREEGVLVLVEGEEVAGDFFFFPVEDLADLEDQPCLPQDLLRVFLFPVGLPVGSAEQRGEDRLGRVVVLLPGSGHRRHRQGAELGRIIVLALPDVVDEAEKTLPVGAERAGSMYLTETVINEKICRSGSSVGTLFRLDRLEEMERGTEQIQRVLAAGSDGGARKIQSVL